MMWKRCSHRQKIGGVFEKQQLWTPPSGWNKFGPVKVPGLVQQGNLDLTNRPRIRNDDGSISTEFSFSFGDGKGHEILVPTVVNGKFLTPDGKKPPEGKRVKGADGKARYVPSPEEKAMWKRAQEHYEKTGEHLGVFDTTEHADAAAERIHNRFEAMEPPPSE